MYGYSFGAAKSGVWHTWGQDYMLYPTYTPQRKREAAAGRLSHMQTGSDICHGMFYLEM